MQVLVINIDILTPKKTCLWLYSINNIKLPPHKWTNFHKIKEAKEQDRRAYIIFHHFKCTRVSRVWCLILVLQSKHHTPFLCHRVSRPIFQNTSLWGLYYWSWSSKYLRSSRNCWCFLEMFCASRSMDLYKIYQY